LAFGSRHKPFRAGKVVRPVPRARLALISSDWKRRRTKLGSSGNELGQQVVPQEVRPRTRPPEQIGSCGGRSQVGAASEHPPEPWRCKRLSLDRHPHSRSSQLQTIAPKCFLATSSCWDEGNTCEPGPVVLGAGCPIACAAVVNHELYSCVPFSLVRRDHYAPFSCSAAQAEQTRNHPTNIRAV